MNFPYVFFGYSLGNSLVPWVDKSPNLKIQQENKVEKPQVLRTLPLELLPQISDKLSCLNKPEKKILKKYTIICVK